MNTAELKKLETIVKTKWIKPTTKCNFSEAQYNSIITIQDGNVYFKFGDFLISPDNCLYSDNYGLDSKWESYFVIMKKTKENTLSDVCESKIDLNKEIRGKLIQEVHTILNMNKRSEAIKLVRAMLGLSQQEANDFIDSEESMRTFEWTGILTTTKLY